MIPKHDVKAIYNNIAKLCVCGHTCETAMDVGYSSEDLQIIPTEANLGLSCGNPTAIAELREGENVLDLGSGAGFDCFLAASKVGEKGKVTGVDFSAEMIGKAKAIAQQRAVSNVLFMQGDIENLPIDNGTMDVVISNCVLNLISDKEKVYREIFRVLKQGGRIAIADIALCKALPAHLRQSSACLFSAITIAAYEYILSRIGFNHIVFSLKKAGPCFSEDASDPLGIAISKAFHASSTDLDEYIVSVGIKALKL